MGLWQCLVDRGVRKRQARCIPSAHLQKNASLRRVGEAPRCLRSVDVQADVARARPAARRLDQQPPGAAHWV
jgi:hypothetical protein